jgi:hypothetical protein
MATAVSSAAGQGGDAIEPFSDSRSDSVAGGSWRWQRHAGQGTGQAVGNPSDFDRRPASFSQCDRGTELGKLADEMMLQGKLVPDSLVNDMVAARLVEPDTKSGFILDGFPRTIGAGKWLDEAFGSLQRPCR